MELWFFIIDIIIAIIGLFFNFYIAPGISVGSLLLCVVIVALVIKFLLYIGKSRGGN